MILIGILPARVVGKQHRKIRHQIRQAMFAIGNQACDFDNTPTTICVVDCTTFTPALTHVERDAVAARSAGRIGESSSDSAFMLVNGTSATTQFLQM